MTLKRLDEGQSGVKRLQLPRSRRHRRTRSGTRSALADLPLLISAPPRYRCLFAALQQGGYYGRDGYF